MIDGGHRVPITALVLAAPHASVAVRAAAQPEAQRMAAGAGGLAFTTCRRVELYLPRPEDDVHTGGGWSSARRLDGAAAARHLISTAIGLESAVLAEDQVLHQLRAGVAAARRHGSLARELETLVTVALRAGRAARSWRPNRPRSLADAAVERLAVHRGGLAGRRVLVVGAGEMGRLAAVAAARLGARVAVASPTASHARDVATSVGSDDVLPFDPGPAIAGIDGVVVALSGSWTVGDETRNALIGLPLVVDLSMPPALSGTLIGSLGERYVDLDRIDEESGELGDGALAHYRRRLEELRDRTLEQYLRDMEARGRAGLAVVLAEHIERERAAELDALWRRLPDLPAEDRAAIDGMTRHLAKRLLGAPLARLGSDPDGRRRRAAEELFEL